MSNKIAQVTLNRRHDIPNRKHNAYDTVSDVVESRVHQCQQNSDAKQDGLILPREILN